MSLLTKSYQPKGFRTVNKLALRAVLAVPLILQLSATAKPAGYLSVIDSPNAVQAPTTTVRKPKAMNSNRVTAAIISDAEPVGYVKASMHKTIVLYLSAFAGSIILGTLVTSWIVKLILAINAAIKAIATQQALPQSEETFRAIFNQAFQFISLLQPDGLLLEANQTALDFAGITRAQAVGLPFWETYWWQNSATAQAQLQAAIAQAAQGEFVRYEVEVSGYGGKTATIDFSLRPLVEKDKVLLLIAEGRDITDRKQKDQELEMQRQFLRSVLDVCPNPIFVKDQNGVFIVVNQATGDVYGVPAEQLIGKSDYDFNSNLEQIQEFLQQNQETMTTGQVQVSHAQLIQNLQDKIHWYQTIIGPFRNAKGEIQGIIGACTNITALKHAEAKLTDQKQFLQQVIDTVPSAIFVKDQEGRYMIANQAAADAHGTTVEAMLGKHEPDFNPRFTQPQLEQFLAMNQQVMATHRPIQKAPYTITTSQGQVRWYQTTISPLINLRGQVQGIVGNAVEITHLKQMEEELKQTNQELERIVRLDALTQVANRRHFDEYLTNQWQQLAQEHEPLSLILFDIDYFKRYNDYYGHQQGDECLVQVAQAARNMINQSTGLLARYGGEEFAVILPNADLDSAIAVATAIQHQVWRLQILHPASAVSQVITLSLGVSSKIPQLEQAVSELISTADIALYNAKRQGRDRIHVANSDQIIH